jgi:molybdopterin-guanine dinucleotide biosynthesis protein A
MPSLETSVVGAVLAGGASRRLGQDKALLPWSGKALLLHPFEVLQAVVAEVVVVTVPGRSYEQLGVPVVHDRFEGQGPLAGIHAALEWAGSRPVFVVACDLPFVSAELVRHVAAWSTTQEAFTSRGDQTSCGARARVAVWEGRKQPLFGLYSASCRDLLETRLRECRLEAWRFLDAIETESVPVTPALHFFRPDLLVNINSPSDLQRSVPEEASAPSDPA